MKRRINRIAIFVDYDNFTSGYKRRFGEKITTKTWRILNARILKRFQEIFPFNEDVDHIGTWISIGISEIPSANERNWRKHLQELDCINCFNVKYGIRNEQGKEKGVDSEIICQMLEYAITDRFDHCILFSDDADFIPAVNRVQDHWGKRVINAGFQDLTRLRAACFGNLKLHLASGNFEFPPPSSYQ